jgi:hypothetical protein
LNLYHCPHCPKTFKAKTGLGSHLRTHGVAGTSPTTVKYREQRDARAARSAVAVAAAVPPVKPSHKRKYTKRSTEIANLPQAQDRISRQPHPQDRTASGIPETTLAVAYGRFTELCNSMANEFDLPPRTFAAQLATLIARAHSQIRH